jgi:thiopeptide-type bacteriocin biosynthesis protein
VYRYRLPGDETSDVLEIRATPAIATVLAACEPGPASRAGIQAALEAAYPGTAPERLEGLIVTLTDRGLLLADRGLVATGAEPGELAAAFLQACGRAQQAAAVLRAGAAAGEWRPVSGGYLHVLDDTWRGVAKQVPVLETVAVQHRYHVELRIRVDGTVGHCVVRGMAKAMARLEEIFPPVDLTYDFASRFADRYGDGSVPLLEAADPEQGVFGQDRRSLSELAAGVHLGGGGSGTERSDAMNTAQVAAFRHWLRTGTAYDLGPPADESASVSVSILAGLIDPDSGPAKAILLGSSPRSPAVLLARFACAQTELAGRLRDQVRATSAARASQADAISAEVLYHPGGRIGNVLIRPSLCDETIALTGAARGTLSLDRLLLRAEGERVGVYDGFSGRPVVLFLSSAHHVDSGRLDPLYRLLANICQRAAGPWNWGWLATMTHLPRVHCADVIVAPERWRLTGAEVSDVVSAGDPVTALRDRLPGLGERRWLGVGTNDQKLAIDTSHARGIREILGRLRRQEVTDLTELPHVEHPAVRGPHGGHVAEVAIGRADARHPYRVAEPQCEPQSREDWLYIQYFCGASCAEQVIASTAGLAGRLREAGAADLWFFVRYGEGGNHVRVRIRATTSTARMTVLAAIEDLGRTLLASGVSTGYRIEPYLPEVRRYGGEAGLPLAERLFSADSDDVAMRIRHNPGEADRLIIGASDVYAWWDAVQDSGAPSVTVLRTAQRSMALGGEPNRKRVGQIIREHREDFDRRFSPELSPSVAVELGQLAGTVAGAWGGQYVTDVIGSAVHMHCNRLFAFDQRRMEYLAYEFAIQHALRQLALAGTRTEAR